jgi:hypothetical protein
MNELERHDPNGQSPSEREPGRPTGTTDEDGLRPGKPQADAPTEAPEERGETPAVEHAPGGDL